MPEKSERFDFVYSPAEKKILQDLAYLERIPAAAVVRRLLWAEADRWGLLEETEASGRRRRPGG